MSALTIKIPEPIMDPATIIVPSNKPSVGLKEVCSAMEMGLVFKISNSLHFRESVK
jgi:hypothetical protein